MRKVVLLLVAVALVCVAASQASAGGYRHAGYAAASHHGGHNAVVYQVARGHHGYHGYQYAPRYYGHGCTSPPVVVHRPVYGHPRVVVPYAQPYYVPQRGISYHGSGISIGIGF